MTADLIAVTESLCEIARTISQKEEAAGALSIELDELRASIAYDWHRLDELLDAVRNDTMPVQLRPTVAGMDAVSENGRRPAAAVAPKPTPAPTAKPKPGPKPAVPKAPAASTRRYSDEQRARAVEIARTSGLTAAAAESGAHSTAVKKWCREDGVAWADGRGKRTWRSAEEKLEIVAFARAHGFPAAAREHGVHAESIRGWAEGKRLGNPGRPKAPEAPEATAPAPPPPAAAEASAAQVMNHAPSPAKQPQNGTRPLSADERRRCLAMSARLSIKEIASQLCLPEASVFEVVVGSRRNSDRPKPAASGMTFERTPVRGGQEPAPLPASPPPGTVEIIATCGACRSQLSAQVDGELFSSETDRSLERHRLMTEHLRASASCRRAALT